MKKMVRFLGVLLSVIMLLGSISVFAEANQSIVISSVTAAADSEADASDQIPQGRKKHSLLSGG